MVPVGPSPSSQGSSKSLNIDGVGRMALKHVDEFVSSFYEPQTFNAAAATLVPTALAQIAETIRIPEAGHLRCRFGFSTLVFYTLKMKLMISYLFLVVRFKK